MALSKRQKHNVANAQSIVGIHEKRIAKKKTIFLSTEIHCVIYHRQLQRYWDGGTTTKHTNTQVLFYSIWSRTSLTYISIWTERFDIKDDSKRRATKRRTKIEIEWFSREINSGKKKKRVKIIVFFKTNCFADTDVVKLLRCTFNYGYSFASHVLRRLGGWTNQLCTPSELYVNFPTEHRIFVPEKKVSYGLAVGQIIGIWKWTENC